MPRHPLCPEHNQFKISGSGLDLFATSEGVEPVAFGAVYYGEGGTPVYGGSFVDNPVAWLFRFASGKPDLTDRFSIMRAERDHDYCVTPDTGRDDTYWLRIVRRET
jgi:hypothetical protein